MEHMMSWSRCLSLIMSSDFIIQCSKHVHTLRMGGGRGVNTYIQHCLAPMCAVCVLLYNTAHRKLECLAQGLAYSHYM